MLNALESLFTLARERKKISVEGSYTNKLLNDKSLSKKKVLEEIVASGVMPPADMRLIPAGSFFMGLDETDLSGLKPAHRVY